MASFDGSVAHHSSSVFAVYIAGFCSYRQSTRFVHHDTITITTSTLTDLEPASLAVPSQSCTIHLASQSVSRRRHSRKRHHSGPPRCILEAGQDHEWPSLFRSYTPPGAMRTSVLPRTRPLRSTGGLASTCKTGSASNMLFTTLTSLGPDVSPTTSRPWRTRTTAMGDKTEVQQASAHLNINVTHNENEVFLERSSAAHNSRSS